MDKLKISTTHASILKEVANIDIDDIKGAHNVRLDGKYFSVGSSKNIEIIPRGNKDGIEVYVKENTIDETIFIPVAIGESGVVENVINNFYIGNNSSVNIIAGCGIHNSGNELSRHDGIHSFFVGENSKVTYEEKHFGSGEGTGDRVLNPVTNIVLEKGSYMKIETFQIKGVSSTERETYADVKEDATLIINEKLLTTGNQYAKTGFEINLNGHNSSTHVVSRSVGQDNSTQIFLAKINGNAKSMGHSECDAIIMDNASVKAIPEVTANHIDTQLIHEAAIGKIAGEQIIKLMTLGLSEREAELEIINGFLR